MKIVCLSSWVACYRKNNAITNIFAVDRDILRHTHEGEGRLSYNWDITAQTMWSFFKFPMRYAKWDEKERNRFFLFHFKLLNFCFVCERGWWWKFDVYMSPLMKHILLLDTDIKVFVFLCLDNTILWCIGITFCNN